MAGPPGTKECAMLVLTRKLQEKIRIGDNVTITVLRVKGQAVRIGIDAPREVRVVRAELPRDGGQAASADTNEASPSAEAPRQDASHSSSPAADEQPPAEFTSRRLPQRRMINRYGAPPLRLACSH